MLSKRRRAAVRAIAEPHQHAVLALAMGHQRAVVPLLERVEAALARYLSQWSEVGQDGERRWTPHAYRDLVAFAEMVARQVEKRLAAELEQATEGARRMGAEHADADFLEMSAVFFQGAG